MTVHDLKDAGGRVFAFEVDNSALGRAGVCRLVSRIPGCRVVRRPKTLSWLREDDFCEFEVGGVRFAAVEDFGDNSRYWVGPQPPRWVPQVETVRQAFISKTGVSRWLRGEIVVLFVVLLLAIVLVR